MFEVVLHNGDRATADSESRILYAARLLISEASTHYGKGKLLRKDVIVTRNRIYDGRLTQAAREGR